MGDVLAALPLSERTTIMADMAGLTSEDNEAAWRGEDFTPSISPSAKTKMRRPRAAPAWSSTTSTPPQQRPLSAYQVAEAADALQLLGSGFTSDEIARLVEDTER
ncbi:MAG: hypothetical protein MZV70_05455 [Desulfobacterales bacterium]|nr:hypothetical protein [Desulfobacterales bacterium]